MPSDLQLVVVCTNIQNVIKCLQYCKMLRRYYESDYDYDTIVIRDWWLETLGQSSLLGTFTKDQTCQTLVCLPAPNQSSIRYYICIYKVVLVESSSFTSFADVVQEVPVGRVPEGLRLPLLLQTELLTQHWHRHIDGEGRHAPLHAPTVGLHIKPHTSIQIRIRILEKILHL